MKIQKVMSPTLILSLLLSGCLPVLVGGLIYQSSKSEGEKREFIAELNRINIEREKAGLKPLDKCIEMYHFDAGWAAEKADCKGRIDSLQMAGVPPDSTKVFRENDGIGRNIVEPQPLAPSIEPSIKKDETFDKIFFRTGEVVEGKIRLVRDDAVEFTDKETGLGFLYKKATIDYILTASGKKLSFDSDTR